MLVGSANLERWADAPHATPERAKSLNLGAMRWLQTTYEPTGRCVDLFPKGLHPTTPVLVTIQVWDVPGGDLGAFKLAQVRLSCRAGIRIRALMTNTVIDSADAAKVLSEGWGYAPNLGEIGVSWRTDRVEATVHVDGNDVLATSVAMPLPIAAEDLQHITNINPAFVGNDLHMLQAEPQMMTLGVQRGSPELGHFDAAFWNIPNNAPTFPVIGATADVETMLPPVRFMQDPEILAHKGTKSVEAA